LTARKKVDPLSRPLKRAEYGIFFISRQADKGWSDQLATSRNAVVDAWQRLCGDPTREDGERVYRLQAGLGRGTFEGKTFDRYQYKLPGGARIWYFVEPSSDQKAKVAGRVLIEVVHTAHPNETK